MLADTPATTAIRLNQTLGGARSSSTQNGGMTTVVSAASLRGWSKDVQRAVFQPVAVAIFLMTAAWLGANGTFETETIKLFVLGLPMVVVGTWLGLKLFGRVNEMTFRRIVLALLFASGVALIF
jgi:uncharacterized protein